MTSFDGFEEFAADLDAFAEELREFAAGLDAAIDDGIRDTTLQIQGTARRKAPVDEGELRNDINVRRLDSGKWEAASTAPHAAAVEFGTSPHVITADDGYLAFEGRDGEMVYRKSVQHPGTPAQPYFRSAVHEHESDLVANIQDEIDALAAEVFS